MTIHFPKPNSGPSSTVRSFRIDSAPSNTPADVHYGRAAAMLEVRHHKRLAAFDAHPERFVHGPPRPETLPHAVWTNPPANTTTQEAPGPTIVTPADPQIRGPQLIISDPQRSTISSLESLQ